MSFSKQMLYPAIVLAGVMVSCAPQGQGILGAQSSMSEIVDSATKQAPFAYDIAADTISYNSCVTNTVADTNTIPSFKIGVNEGFTDSTGNGAMKAGLKLKTEFLQYMSKRFTPEAPSSTISAAQIQSVLSKSDLNKHAYLQFSVRKKDDLSLRVDMLSPGANAQYQLAQPGRDVILYQKQLGQGQIGSLLTADIKYTTAGAILAEGRRISNLSDSNQANPIEATFGFNKTSDESYPAPTSVTGLSQEPLFGVAEYYAHKIREDFNTSDAKTKLLLTATFGGSQPEVSGVTPTAGTSESTIAQLIRPSASSSASFAYGRGYALTFSSKSATGVAGWVKSTLSGVKELDLATGNEVQGPTWTCENFLIVKSNHWNNKKLFEPTCAPLQGSEMASRAETLKKIRRHYSEKDWNVGLFYPANTEPTVSRAGLSLCLSSKVASCYLPTTGVLDENANTDIGINYDTSKECYLTYYNAMGVTYNSSLTTTDARRKLGRCAQFASVCIRKN